MRKWVMRCGSGGGSWVSFHSAWVWGGCETLRVQGAEPLFSKVKKAPAVPAGLSCSVMHTESRCGCGCWCESRWTGEGSSAPLFNILLQAALYLSPFPGDGETGQEFLHICILSTFSAEAGYSSTLETEFGQINDS